MIEKLYPTNGNILALRAKGKLTTEDYENQFIPDLEQLIEEHGKVRVLIQFDEDFSGWELGAAWDDAKFGIKHNNDFEKIAIVGGPKYVEWGVKLSTHFMSGEMKTYDSDELEQASAWITE